MKSKYLVLICVFFIGTHINYGQSSQDGTTPVKKTKKTKKIKKPAADTATTNTATSKTDPAKTAPPPTKPTQSGSTTKSASVPVYVEITISPVIGPITINSNEPSSGGGNANKTLSDTTKDSVKKEPKPAPITQKADSAKSDKK
jgi:hypothetical protein